MIWQKNVITYINIATKNNKIVSASSLVDITLDCWARGRGFKPHQYQNYYSAQIWRLTAQIWRLTLDAENDRVAKISKLKQKITLKSQIRKTSFLDELNNFENFIFSSEFE